MRVFVTGATGFVGSALVERLRREHHGVMAWVRDPALARRRFGGDVELIAANDRDDTESAISRSEAVVNLAGESLMAGRWTNRRKEQLVRSRVDTTSALVASLERGAGAPRVWVGMSAVGYYGDRYDCCSESDPSGEDFLARLCLNWETANLDAGAYATRVVVLRSGIVLGQGGGALSRMLPLFDKGLGGRLGHGRQWWSWIHRDDLVNVIMAAIDRADFSGVFNATAPQPVTNATFTKILAQHLHRPAVNHVPRSLLKLVLGGGSVAVLASQNAPPQRLLAHNFHFVYPRLEDALAQVIAPRVAARHEAANP